jgi:hypothetical protein
MLNIDPMTDMLAGFLQRAYIVRELGQTFDTQEQKVILELGSAGACGKTVSHEDKGPWNIDLFLAERSGGLGQRRFGLL